MVSKPYAIHKCLMTYLDMTSNMTPNWYIQNVYDSCNRKGYHATVEEISKLLVLYRPEFKGKYIIQDGDKYINL